ncbi:MAG: aspartate kinase, partial [Bacteroidales bacterium]|nr:aspartate kinase [Bacteroidales bacterium]
DEESTDLLIVVSAMGKTTNALEMILKLQCEEKDWSLEFEDIKQYHHDVCEQLLQVSHPVSSKIENIFLELSSKLKEASLVNYDYYYDQIVSQGEILSTIIISYYLNHVGISCAFLDAREIIYTNENYRSAEVDMDKTTAAILNIVKPGVCLTQGFIGHSSQGHTTTLGREGSDYTAAIFAAVLNVKELTIWKDVNGVYNADPKLFKGVKLITNLSYKEAVELAFYGASIIHPKTIRPLREKGIVLKVRSFYDRDNKGSLISNTVSSTAKLTTVIVKEKQTLLSLTPKDFNFMDGKRMGNIFQIISDHHHSINLIQNSAISFSICVDENYAHFEALKEALMRTYLLRYNQNQILITIRHYSAELIENIESYLKIKMEQKNRSTYQLVIDKNEFDLKFKEILRSN